MYKTFFKEFIDRVVAFVILILLTPLLIILAILIKLDSRGPVFFLQQRLGKDGRIFTIFKFRSMVVKQEYKVKSSELSENHPFITRVGGFLRKTSLDEVPQIINVMKGDMSFIGPRPPVPHFPKIFEEYSSFEKKRFEVKPGISGLAQLRCREVHDWAINIPIDVEYVESLSFYNDVKLFLMSLLVFFKTDNIYENPKTN